MEDLPEDERKRRDARLFREASKILKEHGTEANKKE